MSFYTVSSSGSISSSSSTAGTDYTEDTPLTTPSTSTHDTSRASYHIDDIASFAGTLQNAANRAFPNRDRSRYQTVHVCLIRWAEDELEVKSELERLYDVFTRRYNFNCEIWLIPSTASQIQLTSMTCSFIQKYDSDPDNLFIVYYGGHGTINAARQNQWWCQARRDSPVVDWSAVQTLFGTAMSDVLVLLDCCAAASSAPGSGRGVMEGIAACGFETRAPWPGQYSFTNTLIEVLEDWANRPSFSAAMLHTEVLFVLKQKAPERGRDGRTLEWCATPVHWVNTSNPKASGIEICTLRNANSAEQATVQPSLITRLTTYTEAMDIDEDMVNSPLNACSLNGNYQIPHVLISVALEENQGILDAASCRRWLADFPAFVKYATVEGVYKGYSTLLTLSLPVVIWDMLPENPACSFIGYVTSPNKYNLQAAADAPGIFTAPSSISLAAHRSVSVDSSYGSGEEEEHHKHLAKAVREACLSRKGMNPNARDKNLEPGEESDSSWEELISAKRDTDGKLYSTCSKSDRGIAASRYLLSKMQKGIQKAAPVDIVVPKRNSLGPRYRSPDQKLLSEENNNDLTPMVPNCSTCVEQRSRVKDAKRVAAILLPPSEGGSQLGLSRVRRRRSHSL